VISKYPALSVCSVKRHTECAGYTYLFAGPKRRLGEVKTVQCNDPLASMGVTESLFHSRTRHAALAHVILAYSSSSLAT